MKFKVNDRVRVKDGVLNAGEAGTVIRVHGFQPSGTGPDGRKWPYGVLLDNKPHAAIGFEEDELDFTDEPAPTAKPEMVNHPAHYGGDTVYEVYKVLDAWGLVAFAYIWNAIKYLARCNRKGNAIEDLKKARWYIDREIERRELEASKEKT